MAGEVAIERARGPRDTGRVPAAAAGSRRRPADAAHRDARDRRRRARLQRQPARLHSRSVRTHRRRKLAGMSPARASNNNDNNKNKEYEYSKLASTHTSFTHLP